jgi:hypothetical protein
MQFSLLSFHFHTLPSTLSASIPVVLALYKRPIYPPVRTNGDNTTLHVSRSFMKNMDFELNFTKPNSSVLTASKVTFCRTLVCLECYCIIVLF